jgi:hypothetical protein
MPAMGYETQLKNHLSRLVLWTGLVLIVLLTVLSIYGAFIGAEAAGRFFNSIPLIVYWLAFTALLITAIAFFRRLLHIRGLFLIHIGCVLVLLGGIWGSKAGLKIRDALFETDTIHRGQMVIYEGEMQREVITEDNEVKELPFAVKLIDFRLEYYQPGYLLIQTSDGEGFRMPAETGRQYFLGDNIGSVEIVRQFEKFKIFFEGDKRIAFDDPNGKPNPALELRLRSPDGSESTRYVSERFGGHIRQDDLLAFSYRRPIRDFISDLEVIKDNKVVLRKSIEVNKPLHFSGYLFYQHSYDSAEGKYTVLQVVSDNGLVAVYLGYILLCSGLFWHLWLRHVFGDRAIED